MSKQFLQTHTLPSTHPTDIFALATTPHHLLSASGGSSIKIHSVRKGTAIHNDSEQAEEPYPLVQTLEKAHALGVHHLVASAEGNRAVSVGFGGEVRVWGCEIDEQGEAGEWKGTGRVVADKKAPETWAVALSTNGQYLAATTQTGDVDVYNTTNLPTDGSPTPKTASFTTKGSFGLSIDLSPDGALTASGHANGTVHLFSNTTSRLTHSLPSLLKPVRVVKFSPTSRYLAAAGDSRVISIYDTQTGEQVANLTGHASWVVNLDWSWSGEWLLSGGYDGKAKVWSVERRECVATLTEGEGGGCLWGVKWLWRSAQARNEGFVIGGGGGGLAFYREASGA